MLYWGVKLCSVADKPMLHNLQSYAFQPLKHDFYAQKPVLSDFLPNFAYEKENI